MPLLLLLLALPLIVIALMPLILWQRYRAGTARRLARPWIATLNAVAMAFSVAMYLVTAAITNFWVPQAFAYAVMGVGAGSILGVLGLLASRWEPTPRTLHYTPNRWLVLAITLVVTARIIYGLVRGWLVTTSAGGSFFDAFGIAGSIGAGGIVLGYYLAYGIGLRWRIRQWERRALRMM